MTSLLMNDKKYWLRFYCLLWCLSVTFVSYSSPVFAVPVTLVLSKDTASYVRFVSSAEKLVASRRNSTLKFQVVNADDFKPAAITGKNAGSPKLLVPVGSKACRIVTQKITDKPILCTLLSEQSYQRIRNKNKINRWSKHSAQYISQPLKRFFALIRAALPKIRSVGVMRSDAAFYQLKTLRVEAKKLNLKIKSIEISNPEKFVSLLNEVLKDSQILISLPDKKVLNSRTVQSLFLTTYLQGVPVVAYSQPYVRAGALMTVYSTPEQLGEQLGQTLLRLEKVNRWLLSAPVYPDNFFVSVNKQVADSMGLDIAADDLLKKRIVKILEDAQ